MFAPPVQILVDGGTYHLPGEEIKGVIRYSPTSEEKLYGVYVQFKGVEHSDYAVSGSYEISNELSRLLAQHVERGDGADN